MGSRRRWNAALVAACVAAVSCTVGAPPGFSEGDSWTIPLIGPLEDGLLLVPGLVNGKGPFVFLIDPDAHVSIVDEEVLKTSNSRSGEGPHLLDESDTQQPRFYAEILEWKLGTLTVKGPKSAQIVPANTFDADGRRIHGVIGRDIIADSLVFGFNRDTGVAWLSTRKSFKPSGATIKFSSLTSRIQNAEVLPISRRLVDATINGQRFVLHADFGSTPSQLRARSWAKAKLRESELQIALVDEVGTAHEVKKQGVADVAAIGNASSRNVSFVPYFDKRWPDEDLEGTLGLNFFRPYVVSIDWDKSTIYLVPRKDAAVRTQTRIGRWHSKTLSSCRAVGCVTAKLIDPLAGKPADQMPAQHPGLIASFVRDPAAKDLDLEVLVAVTQSPDKAPLKWFVANLPAGKDRAMVHVPSDYLGATLTVLDVSLFPRKCPTDDACVDMVLPGQQINPESVQVVPTTALHRRTGERPSLGTTDTSKIVGLSNKNEITSVVKICIDTTGAVKSVTVEKPSGLPQYDVRVVSTITQTWSYDPYLVAGKPMAVCTTESFTEQGFYVQPMP